MTEVLRLSTISLDTEETRPVYFTNATPAPPIEKVFGAIGHQEFMVAGVQGPDKPPEFTTMWQAGQDLEEVRARMLIQSRFVNAIKNLPGVYGIYFGYKPRKIYVWTEIDDYHEDLTGRIYDAEDDVINELGPDFDSDFFVFRSRPNKKAPEGFVRLWDSRNAQRR